MKQATISQPILAALAKVAVSTISRRFAQEDISPLDKSAKTKKFDVTSARRVMRGFFVHTDAPIQRKTHVFYNFKGGTGKTTLCSQTAFLLNLMGFTVLVIDCDAQAHLSTIMDYGEEESYNTLYDVLINSLPIKQAIYPVWEGLDIIPSNLGLTRIDIPLNMKQRREEMLARVLDSIKKDYDFILIDTNPSMTPLVVNALFAADHINVVCETAPLSLKGLSRVIDELERVFTEIRLPLRFSIVANKFESKMATAQEVLGALRRDYSLHMYQSVMRKSEDLNIASKKRLSVLSFAAKNSPANEDVLDFIGDFLEVSRKSLSTPLPFMDELVVTTLNETKEG